MVLVVSSESEEHNLLFCTTCWTSTTVFIDRVAPTYCRHFANPTLCLHLVPTLMPPLFTARHLLSWCAQLGLPAAPTRPSSTPAMGRARSLPPYFEPAESLIVCLISCATGSAFACLPLRRLPIDLPPSSPAPGNAHRSKLGRRAVHRATHGFCSLPIAMVRPSLSLSLPSSGHFFHKANAQNIFTLVH